MKNKEVSKVSKSAWMFIEQAKNNAMQNLTVAVSNGELKVDRKELPRLITLLNMSIDQGYHQVLKTFETAVEGAIDNSIKTATVKPKK